MDSRVSVSRVQGLGKGSLVQGFLRVVIILGTWQYRSWAWVGGLWTRAPLVKLLSALGKQSNLGLPLHAREPEKPRPLLHQNSGQR